MNVKKRKRSTPARERTRLEHSDILRRPNTAAVKSRIEVGSNMRQPGKNKFGSAIGRPDDRDAWGLVRARRVVRGSRHSRLPDMRTTASLRMVPKTDWGFFKRRRDIHSKAGQLLVNGVADELRFVSDSAGVQTFLQRPLKLRIHWEGDQLLIWRPFIRHEFKKSIYILL